MASVRELQLPPSNVKFGTKNIRLFNRGVVTLVDESRLPLNALKEANNTLLYEDGFPGPRWGVDWFGTAASADAIDGAFMHEHTDGTVHLLKLAGGTLYRSTDDGQNWTACTGHTFTVGAKASTTQARNFTYIATKQDPIIRYDGTTVLQVYTAITAPGAPSITRTGLSGSAYTYYYKIAAVNEIGFTEASTAASQAVSVPRDQWDASNYLTLSWSAVSGADRYDIYMSDVSGEETYIASVSGLEYIDNGTAIQNITVTAPEDNTTGGPNVGDISFVESRIWVTDDADNEWRVSWTGSGQFLGSFSSFYDGGYVDLKKGSQFKPVKVEDYRDGKGEPYATVWMKSPDGRGTIAQVKLETYTVGDISFTVPNVLFLPGSRGTNAPNSVVNVLNDYFYYNSQAFYNLGSRAQFLNLLSTDEASANIRPSVKEISQTGSSGIASIYFDAKIFFSVPYGSDTNNHIAVYDTERQAWLPKAYTIGAENFLQYQTAAGAIKLLFWKPGDSQLSETAKNIKGDYGQDFEGSIVTGIQHVDQDRFTFWFVEEGEVEFARQEGSVNVELVGIERSKGFRSLKSNTIAPRNTNVGWTTNQWSTTAWSDTSALPVVFSESSIKRYFSVQRELNAWQYNITWNSKDTDFILRTLQINGSPTNAGKPRAWRI